MQVDTLNKEFGIEGVLTFKNEQHTIMAEVVTPHSTAKISLYGAQVLSFVPNGQDDLLFVSSETLFKEGKAIRGGIPVCWPWFNAHPTDNTKPSHGFARISTWEVLSTSKNTDEVYINLGLRSNEHTKQYFPFDFEAIIEVSIGKRLNVELTTKNIGSEPFEVSAALHTYFNISDIKTVKLQGLHKVLYKDDVLGLEAIQEDEMVTFNGRTDRRYRDTMEDVAIIDTNRTITVGKKGSKTTVVWNPGDELAAQMADLGDDDYIKMVCVESANSLDDTITIMPGALHCLGTTIY
ncbi:D-hexose-6-phosphate mutarotase [Carboxylicivirga caseinilyticus]|uniref:D-hexose-6-phosphate mutarotase n=1 Tax=Carboxylicivirga caseinilyticus TaxID=3417572 RepID=UPI003D35607D|nr:D-hexose-6-phosphate mutarotase [Marinilabiliaceae bacterium A049]